MSHMGQLTRLLLSRIARETFVPARSRAVVVPLAADLNLSPTTSAVVGSDTLAETGRSPSPLPMFLVKAQRDAHVRRELASMGYRPLLTAYTRQLPTSSRSDEFHGLARLGLWPTMSFVGEWLNVERKRHRARFRVTFFGTMLATVLAGLTLNFVFVLFR